MLKTFPKIGPQKAYELRRTPDLRTNKYNMCEYQNAYNGKA